MKYVVVKDSTGEFSGFCSKEQFDKPELRAIMCFEDEGETFEEFDGPEPDGSIDTFQIVDILAKTLCDSSSNVHD